MSTGGVGADVLLFLKVRVAFSFQASEHIFHPKLCSLLVFPVWLTIYFFAHTNVCVNI